MNKFALPLVLLVNLFPYLPGAAAAETDPASCFCVKYRPKEMPPYYIARFTPPPAGCADIKYRTNGRSPEDNGLRSCNAAAGSGKQGTVKAGELSRDRVYGYALKEDGDGLKKYLAPFFEKGVAPDARFVFGIKGGFRSLGRRDHPVTCISSILASKDNGGKMVFAETFGLHDENAEWFRAIAAGIGDKNHWGGAAFTKEELTSHIRFPSGETYDIQMRKYGKDLVTRQTTRYKGDTQVDYGFYYMDLGRVAE
ncbi:MAG: hypothetical protein Q7R35_01775 [Elusimicrobiota bacterium]|nr:hypothetical protein [Elusimicrobiota bacterium]